ncbi:hypothetical protein LWI28_019071 [Acer negundo]|uniref:Uncharacterized protein n=1 Tax=Acer negundo TaxID=4023 RepID=A0AAD5IG20_ACENE|nr:hypothetical protein LWI28_019071 [Acer negundo]
MKRERSSARWYSREHHPQNSCSECIKSDDVLYNSRIEDFVQISSSKQCAKNKMKVDIKLEGGIIYSQNPWEEKYLSLTTRENQETRGDRKHHQRTCSILYIHGSRFNDPG